MKLTVNNIDVQLRVELSKSVEFVEVTDNPQGVFLVWHGKDTANFSKQTKIVGEAVANKTPMIIFDKYQSMDAETISFLIKEGVFLWEPAVSDRMFFSFQPHWGKIKIAYQDIGFDFNKSHTTDLGYMSPLTKKMPSFKQYYQPIAEIGEHRVAYYNQDEYDHITKKVEKLGVTVLFGTTSPDPKMVVLLGTEQDYKTGYLDPKLFEYLEAGIVPLLPTEHRWFHSVFGDLVVDGEDKIDYHLKVADKTSFGCIYDMYQNLATNLPEADVSNVAKRILTYLK